MSVFQTANYMRYTICVLLLACLLGCAGNGGGRPVPESTTADDPVVATAPQGLPAVNDQLLRNASAEPVTFLDGLNHDPALPCQHFSYRTFSPDTPPDEPWEFVDYGCAGYRFNVTGLSVDPILKMKWESFGYPAEWTGETRLGIHTWIGMANWDRHCWDWKQRSGDGMVYLEDLDPYTAADGSVMVVFIVSGYNDIIQLHSLQLGSSQPSAAEWTSYQPELTDQINTMQLAIDADDTPVIAWGIENADETSDNGALLGWLNDDTWTMEYVDTGCPSTYVHSLGFDDAGEPRLACRKISPDYFVAARNGAAWEIQDIPDGYRVDSRKAFSLAPSGIMYLALINDHNLYLGNYDGDSWTLEHVCDDVSNCIGLEHDATGTPYAGFLRSDIPYLARYDSGSWDIEQIWTERAYEAGMTMDGSGNIHLAMTRTLSSLEGELIHAGWSGSAWETTAIDPAGVYCVRTPDMAVLSNGNPVVAYNDYATEETMVAIFDGSGWRLETVDLRMSTLSLDLAVDSQDRIWVLQNKSFAPNLYRREPVT